jgi:hypothetical protein
MKLLGVVGNISRDLAIHPGTRIGMLGGAALHISLAAARAGCPPPRYRWPAPTSGGSPPTRA